MEGRQQQAFAAAQMVALGVLAWLLVTLPTPWNGERYTGTGLALIGVTFIVIARYQLGKSFAIRAEAHELVTRGLYSKIRNPIYVFGTVTVAGVILVLQNPLLWILLVALVIVQTIRARREARVLESTFGDAYREYRRKTWF
jgi:protein-S-isoprenylcysteine O-methyltransferase Ste14